MFPFTEDYLRTLDEERDRTERQRRLLRELRGATPPFGEAQTRRLAAAFAETVTRSRSLGRERRPVAAPCPDVKEPMTS